MKKKNILLCLVFLMPLINYSQSSLLSANGVKYSNSSSSDDFDTFSKYEKTDVTIFVYENKVKIDGISYNIESKQKSGIVRKTVTAQLGNPYIDKSKDRLAVSVSTSGIYSRIEEIIIENADSKKLEWIKLKTYSNNGMDRSYYWIKLVEVPSYYLK